MPGIFPETTAGGKFIRDPAGNPITASGVERAYAPPATFTSTGQFTALPSDCSARFEPKQLNAIVSELVSFVEYLDPNGPWNCGALNNIKTAFQVWWSTNALSNGDKGDI